MNYQVFLKPYLAALSVCLLLVAQGCSSGPPEPDPAQAAKFDSFRVIAQCYEGYTIQNGRAPSSEKDLLPLLRKAGVDPRELLESVGGGADVVVLWGAVPDMKSPEPVVMGYQTSSTNGQRLVITSMGVVTMPDEEFYSAPFPRGHKAPAKPAN